MVEPRSYRIAVIPGDGIGKEVVPEGMRVLEAAAKRFGFELRLRRVSTSPPATIMPRHGRMMPEDWKEQIGGHRRHLLRRRRLAGHRARSHFALGLAAPVPPRVRPVCQPAAGAADARRALPLAGRKPGDIDFFVVRENTEGEYSSIGGKMFPGTEREIVMQETVMTPRSASTASCASPSTSPRAAARST